MFRKLTRGSLAKLRQSLPQTLSQLERIPPELIGLITDYPEKPDIVCLGLTSRAMLRTLGTSSWPKRKDRALRMVVLSRLSREIPPLFCCYYCAKLHPVKLVGPPLNGRLGSGDECPEIGGMVDHHQPGPIPSPLLNAHGLGSLYRFRLAHLALAMERHHYGPAHGIPLESLSYTEVNATAAMFTMLFSVEPRICPAEQGTSFTCHLRPRFRRDPYRAARILECPQCGVEFQLDLWDCGGEGRAVVVTKWLDLGSGLTHDDPRLLALVSRDLGGLDTIEPPVANPGLARRRYHAASGDEVQGNDITERNYRYLAEREYKRELSTSWLDRGVWMSSS
ncbi:hypothetical protein BJX66DRAFT_329995 [Aspergillus keveii]|uniref:F-box domain-containing protein n=1 Tax=Aspergillus keveii TaxID=714993 RepID=A0ABR4FMJ4_9EURO